MASNTSHVVGVHEVPDPTEALQRGVAAHQGEGTVGDELNNRWHLCGSAQSQKGQLNHSQEHTYPKTYRLNTTRMKETPIKMMKGGKGES